MRYDVGNANVRLCCRSLWNTICQMNHVLCLLLSLSLNMPFLCKQPSVVPHILSASKCPPYNVMHDSSQYDNYYDPLYSPADHPLLFDSELSVCVWLLDGLRNHCVPCPSCSSSTPRLSTVKWQVSFSLEEFWIKISSCFIHVPLSYVESPYFSFCHLYCRLLELVDNAVNVFNPSSIASGLPLWLQREPDSALRFLSGLSFPLLVQLVHRLRINCVCGCYEGSCKWLHSGTCSHP